MTMLWEIISSLLSFFISLPSILILCSIFILEDFNYCLCVLFLHKFILLLFFSYLTIHHHQVKKKLIVDCAAVFMILLVSAQDMLSSFFFQPSPSFSAYLYAVFTLVEFLERFCSICVSLSVDQILWHPISNFVITSLWS